MDRKGERKMKLDFAEKKTVIVSAPKFCKELVLHVHLGHVLDLIMQRCSNNLTEFFLIKKVHESINL